jgi:bifunctional enzyme CysN/CysC
MSTHNNSQMSIVIVGHVDHGKSTIIGRLLAETGSLPQGKLEQVREMCRRNARPFEYAFLLDALKDEQAQGITIDTARCFFKTQKRPYILIDAPGHIEFLKNMITGAARAEAVLLTIDAHEGIQENTRRHGYMVSMLGIRQISVLVNKMDLVGYDRAVFERIKAEYTAFLKNLQVEPVSFIPISGMEGTNMVARGDATPWYQGPTVLEQIDAFEPKAAPLEFPFRLPVQDIYKFTAENDDRRIVAGTIETGRIRAGDAVTFYPSRKKSRVKSVEYFNGPEKTDAAAGEAPGFTLHTQIYIKPGELMVRDDEKPPHVGTRFRVNLFWMGHAPMIKGKTYKLKLGAARVPVKLADVLTVLDASELSSVTNKQQIDRHDVAECVLETAKPVAFDVAGEIERTGRLVIVDNHDIAGAGIILAPLSDEDSTLKAHIRQREAMWRPSAITRELRTSTYRHGAKFIVVTGDSAETGERIAAALEKELFLRNFKAYYLGISNVVRGLDADLGAVTEIDAEQVRRIGELARIMTDAGLIFITSLPGIDEYDLRTLELLNQPHEILVVNVGEDRFTDYTPHLELPTDVTAGTATQEILQLLRQKDVILEYYL